MCLWRLFPRGMVVVGREPIRIHKDNYDLITPECKEIMTSRDATTGEIQTISFGTGYHSPQGYVYEVDIYTGTGNAPELAPARAGTYSGRSETGDVREHTESVRICFPEVWSERTDGSLTETGV